MSISFEKLWAMTIGMLIGDFAWYPILGGNLKENLLQTFAVMFFVAMVWAFRKFEVSFAPPDRGVGQ